MAKNSGGGHAIPMTAGLMAQNPKHEELKVFIRDGYIVFAFPQPVQNMAMTVPQVLALTNLLQDYCRKLGAPVLLVPGGAVK